ncbi:FKBP-type peptidyl-prolyl cis-trans isomerase [Duganella aceris]|nr:FKBP-type peptidyl-prolyl cis-trans isomerase [Duganella aceris]
MFQFIATAVCAVALTACGGGTDKTPAGTVIPTQPDYKLTETKVGTTGETAAAGDTIVINFVGYLYDSTKTGGKGAKVESTVDAGKPSPAYTVGVGILPTGWDMALLGMKAGGTRTAVLPYNLAYGASARTAQDPINGNTYAAIPAYSALVYDFEMVSVTKAVVIPSVPAPTVTTITEVTVGTGAEAAAGKVASVKYSGWLYDGTRDTRKGVLFDTNVTGTTTLDVTVDANPLSVIKGFNAGIKGMKVGGKRTVIIPPDQAYGTTGSGSIPANATLVFDIELTAVK